MRSRDPSRKSIITDRVVTSLVRGRARSWHSAVAIPLLWGNAINLHDLMLAAVFYLIAGFGISVGFHRLFTHRSFTPNRPLKFILAAAGSMAFEGSVTSWVANHRRHHMFSDQPGDPHSPHRYGDRAVGAGARASPTRTSAGSSRPTPRRRRASPPTCCATTTSCSPRGCSRCSPACRSRSRSASAGRSPARSPARSPRCIWAGLVRMALFHHVTWSINSICHMFGTKPFKTKDQSTNFAPLACSHSARAGTATTTRTRASARHGVLPRQVDLSAAVIRLLRAGRLGDPGPLARPRRAPICRTPV